MEWHQAISLIEPQVVKIFTPEGSGTGSLIYHAGTLCAIATAAHVIDHAHQWESPIRIQHYQSKETVLLHDSERAMFIDYDRDTAIILFLRGKIPFPENPMELIGEGKFIKTGVEVGWLGFPAVASDNLCFFTGIVSSRFRKSAYLIDGVAINGVSGGPAFYIIDSKIRIFGVISAYIPNRATGDTLPGLCLASDARHFQEVIKKFKTIEQAKKQETPPLPIAGEIKKEEKILPPPPPSEESGKNEKP